MFTLSYDDGVVEDLQLLEMLNHYGAKCTFNLNAGLLGQQETFTMGDIRQRIERVTADQVTRHYQGHEIAGHGLYHSSLADIGTPAAMHEIIEDKRLLEALTGTLLRTFALPFGAYHAQVKDLLQKAGYQSSRTIVSTHTFAIPEDFLEWHPTCHHADARLMELAHTFCEGEQLFEQPQLFAVWGHSYEFNSPQAWKVMEDLLAYLAAHREKIWFATNGEVSAYISDYRRLSYSVDGSKIYNPTATTLWLSVSGVCHRINGGETLTL